jgi:hypothetical protein
MVAPFSTLAFFLKPQKHHNKQTNKQQEQLPEKQTKLNKREIKQTQNKLQIFHAK